MFILVHSSTNFVRFLELQFELLQHGLIQANMLLDKWIKMEEVNLLKKMHSTVSREWLINSATEVSASISVFRQLRFGTRHYIVPIAFNRRDDFNRKRIWGRPPWSSIDSGVRRQSRCTAHRCVSLRGTHLFTHTTSPYFSTAVALVADHTPSWLGCVTAIPCLPTRHISLFVIKTCFIPRHNIRSENS